MMVRSWLLLSGVVICAALVFGGCKKQEENVVNVDEVIGSYQGTVEKSVKDVESSVPEVKDKLTEMLQGEIGGKGKTEFKLEKNPADSKTVIMKDDDFTVVFKDALATVNGILFNIADFKHTEKDGAVVLTFKKGRSLYDLTVNGKKTASYDACYSKNEQSFNFALEARVESKAEVEGKEVKISATVEFEFKAKKK